MLVGVVLAVVVTVVIFVFVAFLPSHSPRAGRVTPREIPPRKLFHRSASSRAPEPTVTSPYRPQLAPRTTKKTRGQSLTQAQAHERRAGRLALERVRYEAWFDRHAETAPWDLMLRWHERGHYSLIGDALRELAAEDRQRWVGLLAEHLVLFGEYEELGDYFEWNDSELAEQFLSVANRRAKEEAFIRRVAATDARDEESRRFLLSTAVDEDAHFYARTAALSNLAASFDTGGASEELLRELSDLLPQLTGDEAMILTLATGLYESSDIAAREFVARWAAEERPGWRSLLRPAYFAADEEAIDWLADVAEHTPSERVNREAMRLVDELVARLERLDTKKPERK